MIEKSRSEISKVKESESSSSDGKSTGESLISFAHHIHRAIEFCGQHPFVTGLFAILSFAGLLLSVVGYHHDRDDARSTNSQVQRVEEKIDKISSSIETPSLELDNESDNINKYWKHLRYSFTRQEFVNPRIVQELIGWISDSAETVTQIDLVEANKSNRFYVNEIVKRKINEQEWVLVEYGQGEGFFGYSYIGTSPSGVHILKCMENLGGQSTFYTLLLLSLNADESIDPKGDGTQTRERVMLKTLGSIILGDRYEGKIKYDGKVLRIGPDQSMMKHGQRLKEESIPLK